MQDLDDLTLLRKYAANNSEAAFEELISRRISFVYSAALRQVRDPQLAEEVTQAVFILLAQKAGKISDKTILTGWLFKTTRFTALAQIRAETKRTRQEKEFQMQSQIDSGTGFQPVSETNELWNQMSPLLDEALAALGETDRQAVLLRFFENKSLAEVGQFLGLGEDTARKRVSRAVEKLHRYFSKRGVNSTTAILAGAISTNSIHATPIGLAKTISTVAVAKGATASVSTLTLIKGALKIMAWSKAKTAIVAGAVIICAISGSTGFYVYHESHLDAAEKLRAALRVKRPATGTWSYPSEKVALAVFAFGSNRANAFPILEEAIKGSNPEARKQAVSALWFVGAPFRPERVKYGLIGEPSPKVVPLLWQTLNSDDGELSSFALTTLRGIGFQPEDIPVLAALLVKSHNGALSAKTMANMSVAKAQKFLDRANNDQQSQRYIPEAIAETIRKNPEAAAPYISSVEDLLDDSNADTRFSAACALAEYKGVDDPKISAELKAGLKIKHDTSGPLGKPRVNAEDNLKQLMAIETIQRVGTNATIMIPTLLEFANSKNFEDNFMRELAFRAVGHIDSNLRNTIPEVDQALKNDPTLKKSNSPQ